MAVISVSDYKDLVTDYEAALLQIEGVSDNYFQAAEQVLLLNVFDPEIDLLVPFHNAYLVSLVAFANQPQSVVDAVTSLQNHILAKGADKDAPFAKFTSINDYYADNPSDFDTTEGLEFFTSRFAGLSTQAGFTIENQYILDAD